MSKIRRHYSSDFKAKVPVLQALPRHFFPKPEALDKLVAAVHSLRTDALQHFIKLVLERRNRLEIFLKAPASGNFYHNDGGLLEHSLEVALNTLGMICSVTGHSTT